MASFTFSSVGDLFGVGTSVGAYLPNLIPGASSPVTGAALATATVQADGSLAFSGLVDDTAYVAYDSGSGRFRRFRSPPLVGSGSTWTSLRYVTMEGGSGSDAQGFTFGTEALLGTVGVDSVSAKAGSYALACAINSGAGNKYSRGAVDLAAVDLGEGDRLRLSCAVKLGTGFKAAVQGAVDLMRWDNFPIRGGSMVDQSGLRVIGGQLQWHLTLLPLNGGDGVAAQTLGNFDVLTEGVWQTIEVEQTFSAVNGRALTIVRVDGIEVGRTTAPNFRGTRPEVCRYGIVSVNPTLQTNALSLRVDECKAEHILAAQPDEAPVPRVTPAGPGFLISTRPGYSSANPWAVADTNRTHKTRETAPVACADIRLVMGPGLADEEAVAPLNTLPIKQWVEDKNGVLYPVAYGGRSTVTLESGGFAVSDPVPINLAAGDVYYVRTQYGPLNGTTDKVFVTAAGYADANEGFSANAADPTAAITPASNNYLVPLAIIAQKVVGTPPPAVLLLGGSTVRGTGYTSTNFASRGGTSFASIGIRAGAGIAAFANATPTYPIPHILEGKGSESAQTYALMVNRLKRSRLWGFATHSICQYGSNDVSARTLAQMQADMLTIWRALKDRGIKVFACTLQPLGTTSTDAYATTANQTAASYNGVRASYNAWLRLGAPVDANGAPVSYVSEISAGQPAHPLAGVFDVCAMVEATQDSGIWRVDVNGPYTTDGTHPTNAGHAAMATAIDITKLT